LGVGFSLSVVRTLRFLGLSPLNVRGLTILDVCVRLELELELKLEIEIAAVGLRVGRTTKQELYPVNGSTLSSGSWFMSLFLYVGVSSYRVSSFVNLPRYLGDVPQGPHPT
jgi:hypothetical protein